jgi:phosphoglycerate dehydrogenase-like enzyme
MQDNPRDMMERKGVVSSRGSKRTERKRFQVGYRVAVVHTPTAEEQAIFHDCLSALVQITYMASLPEEDRLKVLQEADVIVGTNFSAKEVRLEEISNISKASFIQLIFAGADVVPFAQLHEGITVACNVGAFAEPLAEHVLAMALALAKSLKQKHDLLSRGIFEQKTLNRSLRRGICGIIGLGENGKQIGKVMKAMGMKVYGINRSGKTDMRVDFIGTRDGLKGVLEASDLVVLSTPLTRETRDLIGERELKWMKKDAILINVARGNVVNQGALYRHLKAHPDFRAGIDTWWSEPSTQGVFTVEYPFFELQNFIGSPHVADHVPGMMPKATRLALKNVKAYLFGGKVRGIVNGNDYI